MKAMKLPKEIQSFLDTAEASDEETLVFTRKKRPVAALVSLRNVDRESLALSTNRQFLRLIESARKEIRAGKTISIEALERKYRSSVPAKSRRRTQKPSRPN